MRSTPQTLLVLHPPCVLIGSKSREQRGSGWESPSAGFCRPSLPRWHVSNSCMSTYMNTPPTRILRCVPTLGGGILVIAPQSLCSILISLISCVLMHPGAFVLFGTFGHPKHSPLLATLTRSSPKHNHFRIMVLFAHSLAWSLHLVHLLLIPSTNIHYLFPRMPFLMGCWPRHVPLSRPHRKHAQTQIWVIR